MKPKVKIKVGSLWRDADSNLVKWWDGKRWRIGYQLVVVGNNGKAIKK